MHRMCAETKVWCRGSIPSAWVCVWRRMAAFGNFDMITSSDEIACCCTWRLKLDSKVLSSLLLSSELGSVADNPRCGIHFLRCLPALPTPDPGGCGHSRATRRTPCPRSDSARTHGRTSPGAPLEASHPSHEQRAVVQTLRLTCTETKKACVRSPAKHQHIDKIAALRTHMRPMPDIADCKKTPSTVFGAGPMSGMLSNVLQ